METELMYWILEYGKVLVAYTLLMFVWPSVVFNRHLKNKSRTYRFSFCTTVQVVIINMVVLGLGLLHILNVGVFRILFYGVLITMAVFFICRHKEQIIHVRRLTQGVYSFKRFCVKILTNIGRYIKKVALDFWPKDWKKGAEYIILILIVLYGMLYFSYGAFQVHSYGFGDLYVHHSWIYEMLNGKIFSAGVYPYAMHCFIYAMHTLFGVEVYSCLLFLAGIHVMTFLVAVYCFLKEVFTWRFSSLIVLILFLTLGLECIDQVFGMSRLQWTLPQEFGFYAMFLCALYLFKYLKNESENGYKDENLLIFILSLTTTIVIHFYSTMIAFFLCLAVAICFWRKIFRREYLIPLCVVSVVSLIVAFVPMGGALLEGTEFQASIGWGVNIIKGTGTKEGRSQRMDNTSRSEYSGSNSDVKLGGLLFGDEEGNTYRFVNDELILWDEAINVEEGPDSWKIIENEDGTKKAVVVDEKQRKAESDSKENHEQFINNIKNKVTGVYKEGYRTLYKEQAVFLVTITILVAVALIISWVAVRSMTMKKQSMIRKWQTYTGYSIILLASILYMIVYAAPLIGWPELIAGARLCTTEHMMVIAVVVIPFDFVFGMLGKKNEQITAIACVLSIVCCAAIYPIEKKIGVYHSYLYYELTRYNAAVDLTNEIIRKMPKQKYTVVSVTDELYHVVQGGWHEEVLTFVEKSENKNHYTIPTEYIFMYVEKRPLQYAQFHFFAGPEWLAYEKYTDFYGEHFSQQPEVNGSEISKEAAKKELIESDAPFKMYSDLESRTILQSKLYEWCQKFEENYPNQIKTVYEDDAFVCYMIEQNPMSLYELSNE